MGSALRQLLIDRVERKCRDPVYRGTILPFTYDPRNGERHFAWPQAALDIAHAFALPGDTFAGRVDPLSDEGLRRSLDLATLMTGGGGAARGPANAIAMGMKRIPPYRRMPSTTRDFATEIAGVLRNGKSSKGRLFRADLGDITIDWGEPGDMAKNFKGGWGLSHIRAKRTIVDGIDGDAFVRRTLPRILSEGKLSLFKGPTSGRRATITYGNYRADLSLFRDGKRETWLLTGFKKWR
ncbi:MAG: hypothetical protein V6Z86_10040 [Hyphomicrobiales bacterium]